MQKVIDQGILRYQHWIERLVLSKSFWFVLVAMGFSLPIYKSVNRELPPPLPMIGNMGQFSLKDQHGKTITQDNFTGRVVIANFIFTSCPTVCPEMTRKMQLIQKRVRGLGQAIALVSFSVDPKNDTSSVLFKYAQEYKANHYIWSFLTGDENQLKTLIMNNMKLPFVTSGNLLEISHSEKLVLMDKFGNIRGYYQADQDGINQLMIDTGLLINNAFRTI